MHTLHTYENYPEVFKHTKAFPYQEQTQCALNKTLTTTYIYLVVGSFCYILENFNEMTLTSKGTDQYV